MKDETFKQFEKEFNALLGKYNAVIGVDIDWRSQFAKDSVKLVLYDADSAHIMEDYEVLI